MMQKREYYYQYWLANIPGIGNKTRKALLHHLGTAEEVYLSSESALQAILKANQSSHIIQSRKSWNLFTEYEALLAKKIAFTYYGDEHYPGRLLDIPDAPSVLYYIGRLPAENIPSVAIIGARMCSEYGRFIATQFGSILASQGIQIVSGLAMGIDGISQESALKSGGASFGVMGCGVDICYPKSNQELYQLLPTNGGILSEYTPGTQPKPQLFPPRNRIISGLADIVLVVEAKAKSGTLITVDMALEQGREVYAVPGRMTDSLSLGCNQLIKQGAGIATCPNDILQAFQLFQTQHSSSIVSLQTLTEPEQKLLQTLTPLPQTIDAILTAFNETCEVTLPVHELMHLLISLSLKGIVLQSAGARFSKPE